LRGDAAVHRLTLHHTLRPWARTIAWLVGRRGGAASRDCCSGGGGGGGSIRVCCTIGYEWVLQKVSVYVCALGSLNAPAQ